MDLKIKVHYIAVDFNTPQHYESRDIQCIIELRSRNKTSWGISYAPYI